MSFARRFSGQNVSFFVSGMKFGRYRNRDLFRFTRGGKACVPYRVFKKERVISIGIKDDAVD